MVGPYVEDRNTVAVLLAPCFLKLPTISDLGLELKVQWFACSQVLAQKRRI